MDKSKLKELYEKMLLLRHFDEMCFELKMQDLIMNGYHPYVGQEAVAVGVSASLNPDDVVVSNHRPQGHALAKGATPRSIFCEMLGRRGGPSQGIGGPMQWIDSENNFFCGSIVGSGITIAAGVALAMKRENKGRICCCYFGDGASNTGSFHEGMNLASIWKLPVLYILENNQYGEAMPVDEFVSCKPISKRSEAYNMKGLTVDGMDVVEVAEAVQKAVDEIRRDSQPILIETVTYRFRGHYGGDPEYTYRTKEEVEKWRKRCPVEGCKKKLIEKGVSKEELDKLEQKIIKELEEARDWALEQPFPTVEQATDHVWIPIG